MTVLAVIGAARDAQDRAGRVGGGQLSFLDDTLTEGAVGREGVKADGSASARSVAPLASGARSEAQFLVKSSSPAAPSASVSKDRVFASRAKGRG